MPIYMDLHIAPGISAKDAAEAHREDLKIQDEYGCRCMTYWVDEERGSAFCLIDAPDKQAVREMHDRAHGLIPHEIIQVNSNVVEAFLGRIQDPDTFAQLGDADLKIFNDPAFRVIMVNTIADSKLLRHKLGPERAKKLGSLYNSSIREQIKRFEGREVELKGDDFIASFVSVSQAVQCALALQKGLHIAAELLNLRIGIHAGMPVTKNNMIFGDAVKLARYLCFIGKENQIILSSIIQELYRHDWQKLMDNAQIKGISPQEENFLEILLNTLEDNWNDPGFGITDFAGKMTMSKSQLYRKCIGLTNLSPNSLIKEFRLYKSLNLLRSDRNIAQTTFDSGFTSPSYFAKCFQQRFGLQPLAYVKDF
ncbi:nickel-binding protein [Ulvibacterium sp.]|uniref:nickel-binding protein n=1 Tax=Ulvibacterium sp. TaxID=2665914 RepID=UPI003BAAE882